MRHLGRIVAVGAAAMVAACGAGEDTAVSPSPSASSSVSAPAAPPLSLVAIGDSIPFNSRDDCPNCTAFVYQYGDALADATGRTVQPNNLSDHTGLTLPRLLDNLDSLSKDLAGADAIIVGIAHNSIELGTDTPCGSTLNPATGALKDWTKVDQACATRSAAASRPQPHPGPGEADGAHPRRVERDDLRLGQGPHVQVRRHLPRVQRPHRREAEW
jgi:hypothetical protein